MINAPKSCLSNVSSCPDPLSDSSPSDFVAHIQLWLKASSALWNGRFFKTFKDFLASGKTCVIVMKTDWVVAKEDNFHQQTAWKEVW